MGFEVTAKSTPVHRSSLQIELVVLDSLLQTSSEMPHEVFAWSILTQGSY